MQEKNNQKKKCYVLDMFPYPSGEGLHVGHPKGYIATDIYSRYKKMNGYDVIHPMGWDAFGLPAEQFAIKNKVHPRIAVQKNIANFKSQLNKINFDYDWDREINTTDPKFYKWTQWIFKQLYKKGLAYESFEPINWCPSCKTGLANEDLDGNVCERCDTVVEKKPLRQWNLKITEYADRLIDDLDTLEKWPEHIKVAQKNWIGRSEGVKYVLKVKDLDMEVQTFSTHFEAFYADRFAVIAADHKLLPELVKGLDNADHILKEAKIISDKKNANKYEESTEYEGVFTGRYLIDPITKSELPLWVASYALADYGTGIVKCSCHDERDFAFAKKYNLPLYPVLFTDNEEENKKIRNFDYCFNDFKDGILNEPQELKGLKIGEAREKAFDYLISNGYAEKTKAFKLREWVFARQRYWGEPFPVVFDENHKSYVVADSELPVLLPEVENYEPTGTGESPLADIKSFTDVYGYINDEGEFVSAKDENEKVEGKEVKLFRRETNTMPQWAGSSWYYLRFLDPHNDNFLIDKNIEKEWPQVDVYVGGDHATRHLIYARFWHKFLFDIGVVSTIEPFARLEFLGFILAEDGRKMSKRWGNIINPDDVVAEYGADTLRLYEMFMAPFEATAVWSTNNIKGVKRFLERVSKLKEKIIENSSCSNQNIIHQTIKKVGADIETFKFNTAVSQMMICLNEFEKNGLSLDEYEKFMTVLAPFAPEVAKDYLGKDWPIYDENKLETNSVNIALQINGKMRETFESELNATDESIKEKIVTLESYKKYVVDENGKSVEPNKVIIVKNKIVSVVV